MADLDGDAVLDLVTANDLSADVSVLLGNGDGTLEPYETGAYAYSGGIGPISVAVADVNADGFADVVSNDYADDAVIVFLNLLGKQEQAPSVPALGPGGIGLLFAALAALGVGWLRR